MSDVAKTAGALARAGWPVFPVAPDNPGCDGGPACECKKPATKHGVHDADTSPRHAESWFSRHPDHNLAVATGGPGPVVLDVDIAHGKPGFASLNAAKAAGLIPSPSATVRTPSGGAHLYYGAAGGERNGSLPKHGLDWRGEGGYVLVPPSRVHGLPYEMVHHGSDPVPIDLARLREHFAPSPAAPPPGQQHTGPRDVGHLAQFVASQAEGNRGNATFWAACRAAEAGDTATLGAIANAAVSAGLDRSAGDKTIASAVRTVTAAPAASITAAPAATTGREAAR
jgi:hypothetical protein